MCLDYRVCPGLLRFYVSLTTPSSPSSFSTNNHTRTIGSSRAGSLHIWCAPMRRTPSERPRRAYREEVNDSQTTRRRRQMSFPPESSRQICTFRLSQSTCYLYRLRLRQQPLRSGRWTTKTCFYFEFEKPPDHKFVFILVINLTPHLVRFGEKLLTFLDSAGGKFWTIAARDNKFLPVWS